MLGISKRGALRFLVAVAAIAGLSILPVGDLAASGSARAQSSASGHPADVCRGAGTDDTVRETYDNGDPNYRIIAASGQRRGAMGYAWRCAGGKALTCAVDNLASCEKANLSRVPHPAAAAFCRANPNADSIPQSHNDRTSAFHWSCAGRTAVAGRQWLPTNQIDQRGFIAANWRVFDYRGGAVADDQAADVSDMAAAAAAAPAADATPPVTGGGSDPAAQLGSNLAQLAGSALNGLFGPRAPRPAPAAAPATTTHGANTSGASTDGFGFALGERGGAAPLGFVPTVGQGDDGFYRAQGVGALYPNHCNALDREAKYHLAEDWNRDDEAEEGEAVYALADGRVVHSADGGPGWLGVIIVQTLLPGSSKPDDYVTVLYGHLQGRLAQVGDVVRRGQRIASIGDYGEDGADHLHLEVRTSAVRLALGERWCGYTRYQDPFARGWVTPSDFIRSNSATPTAVPPTGGVAAVASAPVVTAAQIRLTPFTYEMAGSSCSLYLDRDQTVFVGGMDYENGYWQVGINGRTYRLNETNPSGQTTSLMSADGRIRMTIAATGTLAESSDPSMPSALTAVSVTIVMGGQSQNMRAYQFCGEG